MQINFERTGGFAGVRLARTIDTETLPAADRDELVRLPHENRLFEAADAVGGGADGFQYSITVVDGARSHTVHIGERGASTSMHALLSKLTAVAKQRDQ